MDPPPRPNDAGDGSVSANLTLKVGDYQIKARMTVPAAPIKPQATLPALQALVDAVVSTAERELEGTDRTVSCKAGCGACCRRAVPIAAVEAYHLHDLVESMPEPRRGIIKRRFAAASRRLKDSGLYDTLVNPAGMTQRERQSLDLAYFQLGIACPFLEAESCSIHPDRPLSCREYLVTSPAENCATPARGGIEPLRVPMVSRTVLRIGTDDGQPTSWRPLALIPDWVAANPDTLPLRPGPEWVEFILSRIGKRPTANPPDEAMAAAAATPGPDGGPERIAVSLPMPQGEVTALQMLPTFRAFAEAMIDLAIVKSTASGKPPSCRLGCAACCRQFVVVSTTEARRIAAVVDTMPEPRRSQVRQRFADVDARIAAWSASVGLGGGPDGDRARESQLARSYVGMNIACPLLEDERCSIYEERPLSCREYLVTSPAEDCSRFSDPSVHVEPLPRLLTSFALDHVLSDETPPVPAHIALALALRWVECNPVDDTPRRAAGVWLGRFFQRLGQVDASRDAPAARPVAPPPAGDEPSTPKVDVPVEPVSLRDMA